jgi:quercetin dioxygenase-like cupin family protein
MRFRASCGPLRLREVSTPSISAGVQYTDLGLDEAVYLLSTAKKGRSKVKKIIPMMVLLFLSTGTVMAQQAKVTSPMSKDLTEIPGKEVLMITVEYAPGGVDPIHRHNAHAFVYVLEGSIVMQVKGGKEVTLTPGQTFYEGPDDVHVVGRNASSTKPAKFLVFLVKDKGAPVLVPVPE